MTTLRCPRSTHLIRTRLCGAALAAGLCLALAACGAARQAPGTAAEAPGGTPPAASASAPEAPAELQTRAAIVRELVDEGRTLRILVEDLRPGERVVLVALEGPDGARMVAGPDAIRFGTRASGAGTTRPRVQLEGGNNDPLGVTLSLDVFSTRPETAEPRESALAWAFLPLPDPAAYAAAPGAWTVRVTLQDEVGRNLEISDR